TAALIEGLLLMGAATSGIYGPRSASFLPAAVGATADAFVRRLTIPCPAPPPADAPAPSVVAAPACRMADAPAGHEWAALDPLIARVRNGPVDGLLHPVRLVDLRAVASSLGLTERRLR